jgi:ribose/xylose/arabinose/galactoside ABC-type transport system permease subunit
MHGTETAGLLTERGLARRHSRGVFLTKYAAALALLVFLLFNCLFTQNFVAWETFSNIFTQATKVALVGLGMTVVIATGGIDISVGSAMGLAATIAAISLVSGSFAGVLLSLAVVLTFGLLAGILTSRFSILPLVSTLALMYVMRGLARGISGHGTVTYNDPALTNFFITPVVGHLPVQFFILLIAIVVMYLVVNRTKFGFDVEAYGNNPVAARISGINTRRVIMICYIVSALFAWISGILVMVMVSSTDPARVGADMELDAIAATVIGGTPITGGYPNIIGTVCGAFLLQLIIMMANMNNIPYAYSLMIKAGIILVALVFHNLWKR